MRLQIARPMPRFWGVEVLVWVAKGAHEGWSNALHLLQ